jgi:hypothetical protein
MSVQGEEVFSAKGLFAAGGVPYNDMRGKRFSPMPHGKERKKMKGDAERCWNL